MAVNLETQYDGLSSREGFNTSLRHFKSVMGLVKDFESSVNLADLIEEGISTKSIQQEQIKPIVNSLLVDKYNYHYLSYNMKATIDKFDEISGEVGKWTKVDIVIAYYSPELGLTLLNPKNPSHWESIRVLKKNEFLTLYGGAFNATDSKKIYTEAIEKMIVLLEGKTVKTPAGFTGGSFKLKKPSRAAEPKPVQQQKRQPRRAAGRAVSSVKKYEPENAAQQGPQPAPQAAAATGSAPTGKRMTPFYGIPVTNELFHNGNVEAWKKIIESFEQYHQGLKVFVFYDGERINDLNTLFKWGKVKRGTTIMVAVAGDDIRDVAKLQKYLRQGASHLFEAFLKGHPNKVLALF